MNRFIKANFNNHGKNSVLMRMYTKSKANAYIVAKQGVINAESKFNGKRAINEIMASFDLTADRFNNKFVNNRPYIKKSNCYAAGFNDYDVIFNVSFPACQVPKKGTKAYERFISHLVIDTNNHLYRNYNLGVYNPNVTIHRARNEVKMITFRYYMVNLTDERIEYLKGLNLVSNY